MTNLTTLTAEQAGGLWDDVPSDAIHTMQSATRGTGYVNNATLATQIDIDVASALALKAPLAAPALTGNATAVTQSTGNSSTRIATTAFVAGEFTARRPYYGRVTWSGSGATLAVTVSGVLATDDVIATIRVKPTQAAYLVRAVPSTDTITFELSAANTSNDAQISYTVIRA